MKEEEWSCSHGHQTCGWCCFFLFIILLTGRILLLSNKYHSSRFPAGGAFLVLVEWFLEGDLGFLGLLGLVLGNKSSTVIFSWFIRAFSYKVELVLAVVA